MEDRDLRGTLDRHWAASDANDFETERRTSNQMILNDKSYCLWFYVLTHVLNIGAIDPQNHESELTHVEVPCPSRRSAGYC